MDELEQHLFLLAKASRYGSVSHSHADQGAFLLHAYGEALAAETGYYIAYGSTMHKEWRRQTHSKNALLIGGKGQYGGFNKALNIQANGCILDACERDGRSFIAMDVTPAYRPQVPELIRYLREIHLLNDRYVIVVDRVDLEAAREIQWVLHAIHPLSLNGQAFTVQGESAVLDGTFVLSSAGPLRLRQHRRFTGVDDAEWAGLDAHYHLEATAPAAKHHRLATLLVPKRAAERHEYVSHFLDDQGFAYNLYTTDQGKTELTVIEKAY